MYNWTDGTDGTVGEQPLQDHWKGLDSTDTGVVWMQTALPYKAARLQVLLVSMRRLRQRLSSQSVFLDLCSI